jgi:outer membrane protein
MCVMLSAGTAAWSQEAAPSPTAASSSPTDVVAPAAPASASPALPVITLSDSVAAAQAAAPNLTLARANLDAARALFEQTRAKNGLSLGGTGSYFHEGQVAGATSTPASAASIAASGGQGKTGLVGENLLGGLTLSGPSTSVGLTAQQFIQEGSPTDQVSSVGLSASQTLFDGYLGGRAAAVVQQADSTYRASQVTYDASLKSLILQTKQAYYTLLGDQNTLLVRQATLKQAAENLALEQGLLQAQRATSLDVLQTQVALTQAQLDLRTAQNTIDTDRRTLSLLVGWPIDKQYSVADSPVPEMPQLSLEDALKTAYQNRPELRTFELNITAAGINLALQKSLYLPVVSVNGSLDYAQDWNTSANAGTFTAGVSVALPPIIDGGLTGAQVQQAADQLSALKIQQDQERQRISIEVQNALFSVKDTKDRLDLAGQNVLQAQGIYNLMRAKLAIGLETTLDVLTAFSALVTAQVGFEQANSNYLLAALNLNNVMGL